MMTTLVEELSERARSLSPEDRARLADELLASLDEEGDHDTEAAWEKEIGRRVQEIKSGKAKLIPADQVFAETARIYKLTQFASRLKRAPNLFTRLASTAPSGAGLVSGLIRRAVSNLKCNTLYE